MSWQHWDPPAIIIPALPAEEIRSIIAHEQVSSVSAEQYFRAVYDQPWNSLQPDGRINMGGEQSASVSPYSEHYWSQVEPGIRSLVQAFWDLGYLTVSSCSGHRGTLWEELDTLWYYRTEPYVSIALHYELADAVAEQLKRIVPPHVRVTQQTTMANTRAIAVGGHNGGPPTVRVENSKRPVLAEQEWIALNYMMQRNYPKWSYITVTLNPWRRLNPFHVLRTQREPHLIQWCTNEIQKHLTAYTA